MKLFSALTRKIKPCIFLSAFLLCTFVSGYCDQVYDSTAFQGYGYYNLNDDQNDLDSQKHKVKHSDPGINDIASHGIHEVIICRILSKKTVNVTPFVLHTYALRAPPEKS